MKNKSAKGFTLAELLIVMAIIVVLAAVAVPTFGKQLETARESGDMEVIRNAYTEALSFAIQDGADGALDGYIGAPPATSEQTDIKWGAVAHIKGKPQYEVDLDAMGGAKFAQNGSKVAAKAADAAAGKWTYVSDKLMGYTVPPVSTMVKYLTFEFKFVDGEVQLNPAEINGDKNALFTPLSTSKATNLPTTTTTP